MSDHTPDFTAHGPDADLVEVTPVVNVRHHAGMPLLTAADRDAQVDDLDLAPIGPLELPEYEGIDTTHPELNYASRSNIVRD